MAYYKVILKPSIEKDLRVIPKLFNRKIMECIESLRKEPFPRQSIKLSKAENLYRIRMGDYRIVYEVNTKDKLIIINYIRHRKEVYKKI
jgi:mRNA interferase RelE/StbE